MKFSFETPIKYLKDLHSSQDYLFVLAHHLDNKKYFEYCKNSKKYKILDNSAYEKIESILPKRLIELANLIKADVIIVPDKIFDKRRSLQLEKEFFKLLGKDRKKFKLMKVVCGKNLKEYLESLLEVAEDNKIDIIGISQSRRLIAPNLTYVMNYLHDNCMSTKGIWKPIHLLGLQHPYELIEAKEFDNIVSIDTGSPINFAFKNKVYPKIKRADEFIRISGEDLETKKKLDVKLTKKNIKILRSYYER